MHAQRPPVRSSPAFGVTVGRHLDQVEALEDLGVDSLWVGGHVAAPTKAPELMMRLARLVTVSSRAQVGSAALVLPLYQPGVVAKQLADLDRDSGGRLAVAVAAGGDYPEEFRLAGVPVGERGARLTESIGLLRRLWSGEEISHHGRHFRLDQVTVAPPPLQGSSLPIIVAGRTAAVPRAATLGDGWMPYFYSSHRYAESVTRICSIAESHGRDLAGYGWYCYLSVLIDDDECRARERAADELSARFRGRPGRAFGPLIDTLTAVGSVSTVVRRIEEYLAAGARHFVLAPMTDGTEGIDLVGRFLTEVAPRLQQ